MKKSFFIFFIFFTVMLFGGCAEKINGHAISVTEINQSAVQLYGRLGIPSYNGDAKYDEIKKHLLVVEFVADGVAAQYLAARPSDVATTKNVGGGVQNLHVLTNDSEGAKKLLRRIL